MSEPLKNPAAERAAAQQRAREEAQRRAKRMRALVKAYIYHDGDMGRVIAEIPKDELESDAWYSQQNRPAAQIMEEGIINSLFSLAMEPNSRGMAAAKVLLPALNKRRYNQGVQKQEVANEGIADVLRKVSEAPLSQKEYLRLVSESLPQQQRVIDITPDKIVEVPSLDDAIATAKPEQLDGSARIEEEADD